jgi:hypothetical protein
MIHKHKFLYLYNIFHNFCSRSLVYFFSGNKIIFICSKWLFYYLWVWQPLIGNILCAMYFNFSYFKTFIHLFNLLYYWRVISAFGDGIFSFIHFFESIVNSNNQRHWQIHIWSQFGA